MSFEEQPQHGTSATTTVTTNRNSFTVAATTTTKSSSLHSAIPTTACQNEDVDSGSEKCGFVCHAMVVLIAVTYTAWILLVVNNPSSGNQQPQYDAAYDWTAATVTVTLPAMAICLFFAAPFVYASINAFAGAVANIDALETVYDTYTVQPLPRKTWNTNNSTNTDSVSTEDSCYFRNPLESNSSSNVSNCSIPEICDLDVADINDLVVRYHLA
jgi:hypothetical protein